MKKLLWITCLSSLCAMTVFGCDDDKDKDKDKDKPQTVTCEAGKYQCIGKSVQQCKAGTDGKLSWTAVRTCGSTDTCNATAGTCDPAGQTTTCEAGKFQCNGKTLQECKAGTSGKLNWINNKTCGSNETCNATAGTCDPAGQTTVKLKAGDACDYNKGFVDVCQDGDAYYCGSDKTVNIDKCGDSTTCMIDGVGESACIQTCNKEGEKSTGCTDDMDYSYQHEIVCTKDEKSGVLFWAMSEDYDSYIECDDYCNADRTGCEEMYKATNEDCNPDTFADSCDANGDVKYCSSERKKVVYYYCSKLKEAGRSCVEFDDKSNTWCFSKGEECSELNQTEKGCYEDDYEGPYTYTDTCTKAKNGKNYWVTTEKIECLGECDSEGEKCIEDK